MSDFTINVWSDGETWQWDVTGTDLTGTSRRITDVADDARSAIVKTGTPLRFAQFSTDVQMVNPYVPDMSLARVALCDIDGTLALHNGRGPFDFDKVETDDVNEPVATVVEGLHEVGQGVVLLSGRQEEYRAHTERWLAAHRIRYTALYMRLEGDRRSDDIVKLELFDQHIRGRYRPWLVLDDRDRCVYLWRLLGLACWQVADGAF